MQIMYKSTRGGAEEVTASQAVLNGLAPAERTAMLGALAKITSKL